MPQENAKVTDLPEQSPVMQARAKLGTALEQLEAIVHARLEEAARLVAEAKAAPAPAADSSESEQWQNACRMLEEQLASLKDDNSRLHSELHQARRELAIAKERHAALEKANHTATAALDDAIAAVESLLKDA